MVWAPRLPPAEGSEADEVLPSCRALPRASPSPTVKEGQRVQRNENASLIANFY